ncbi:MAG: four helix bundle suffix domain-containing protein [Bacteroidales bacterium]|nr:four helix bundle suffix domain-containing protein [Bacteroidales bacterium]
MENKKIISDTDLAKSCGEKAGNIQSVLKKQVNWKELWFYQKTEVLYHMTYVFTKRFLPEYGDRTVDQMVQAARSGKQNIVEGTADGVTSSEMELKLLNVARSSIQELREDYADDIIKKGLTLWTQGHPRFDGMLKYCRKHNRLEDYEKYFMIWNEEEFCNIAITLCRMVDKMMMNYQKKKEQEFITQGGIRERMTAARLGYRNDQKKTVDDLQKELYALRKENAELKIAVKKTKND